MRAKLRSHLRALGPVAAVTPLEALRSGGGAFFALFIAAAISLTPYAVNWGFLLIAPFGASAVLLFAAVNSPLAQPWPVVIGNTVSALAALGVCALIPIGLIAVPLSLGLAILAMGLLRATHPPGGAVALTVALAASGGALPGASFALIPVAAGSVFLVVTAALWARLTGRRYPMRQFGEPGPVLTTDPPATERLGLAEADLRDLLSDYRQTLNLGAEDLARLIAAAEMRAASNQVRPKTAGEIMSSDLITIGPDTSLQNVAEVFCRHGFTSLPVVSPSGNFMGVIFQLHLITALAAQRRGHFSQIRTKPRKTASSIMSTHVATVAEDTPIGLLVPRLSDTGSDAVMVLSREKLIGVVTQTDLIAALSREILRLSTAG